jgi:hypothetical protein
MTVSNYRRSQVEWSIARTVDDTDRRSSGPSAALALDIKRLLDTDRRCEVARTSGNPERKRYAFLPRELPGKGTEVEFSEEDAACLLMAVKLLRGGLPQLTTVRMVRRIRPAIAQELARVGHKQSPGDGEAPSFLVIGSGESASDLYRKDREGGLTLELANICHTGDDVLQVLEYVTAVGDAAVVVEIGKAIGALLGHLTKAPLVKRGRKN